MNNTTTLVTSPEIKGNIGSCEVKKAEYYTDSFHKGVILQDSCTGNVVGQYTYFEWGNVLLVFCVIAIVSLFAKTIFDF